MCDCCSIASPSWRRENNLRRIWLSFLKILSLYIEHCRCIFLLNTQSVSNKILLSVQIFHFIHPTNAFNFTRRLAICDHKYNFGFDTDTLLNTTWIPRWRHRKCTPPILHVSFAHFLSSQHPFSNRKCLFPPFFLPHLSVLFLGHVTRDSSLTFQLTFLHQ